MERKPKMGAAIIEGQHVAIFMDDEQRTASAANDDHTRNLQLLQRRHANEISGVRSRAFLDC
jgi:hypothetical protein